MLGLFEAYKKALYTWIRRRMRPMSIEEAEEKKVFWAKVYALTGWTGLGFITYQAYKGNMHLPVRDDLPKNVATAVQHAKDRNVRFISFRNFEKVEDFKYTKEELQRIADNEPESNPNPQTNNPT